MSNTTFLYSVKPRGVISGLTNVAPFRSPKSLFLTLEDVKICLEKAVVYRRFANEGKLEKVTIGNYERLHNEVFMTEKEYEEFLKENLSKDSNTVKDNKISTDNTAQPEKVETKIDKSEEVSESIPVNEEDKVDVVVEQSVEDAAEEVVESDDDNEVEKAAEI